MRNKQEPTKWYEWCIVIFLWPFLMFVILIFLNSFVGFGYEPRTTEEILRITLLTTILVIPFLICASCAFVD